METSNSAFILKKKVENMRYVKKEEDQGDKEKYKTPAIYLLLDKYFLNFVSIPYDYFLIQLFLITQSQHIMGIFQCLSLNMNQKGSTLNVNSVLCKLIKLLWQTLRSEPYHHHDNLQSKRQG